MSYHALNKVSTSWYYNEHNWNRAQEADDDVIELSVWKLTKLASITVKIEHGKIWCNMKTKFENIHALKIWPQTNSEKYIKSGITTLSATPWKEFELHAMNIYTSTKWNKIVNHTITITLLLNNSTKKWTQALERRLWVREMKTKLNQT